MQAKFTSIKQQTDAFCDLHLDDEYREMIDQVIAALCRKRPSPLLRGKENTWAAGIVHAVGMVNFLYDRSQTPHCAAPAIYSHFGVAASTGGNKSKEVRDLLDMHQFAPDWTLPSRLAGNPLVWMLKVNGMIVDIRGMPREAQEVAYQKGLIPFIPADKET